MVARIFAIGSRFRRHSPPRTTSHLSHRPPCLYNQREVVELQRNNTKQTIDGFNYNIPSETQKRHSKHASLSWPLFWRTSPLDLELLTIPSLSHPYVVIICVIIGIKRHHDDDDHYTLSSSIDVCYHYDQKTRFAFDDGRRHVIAISIILVSR